MKMHKGFFEGATHIMRLFFRPFEGRCEKDDGRKEEKGRKCGRGCGCMPCCKNKDDDAKEKQSGSGILKPGPLTDVLKCMFDASDVEYDYED